MRKAFFVAFILVLSTSWSFAADFVPTVMTLTTPAKIEYKFDGSELTVPFTVMGTPASVWLVINTKGQAKNIVNVRNGYLGWHYVNKIDTTVYVSEWYHKEIGLNEIVWDGTNQDGNLVAIGTYNYYLWAYDDYTQRQLASKFVITGYDWESQFSHMYELNEDGMPFANPLIIGSQVWWASRSEIHYKQHGTHYKWELGCDPNDLSFLQTTRCPLYDSDNVRNSFFSYGGPVFNPSDYSSFYHCCVNIPQKTSTMLKWTFVTDGDAVLDEDWLGWDELIWEQKGDAIGIWDQKPSAYTDRNYIYVVSPGLFQKNEEWNRLRCVSFDGYVIFDKMMHDWYMPDDPNPDGFINGAFNSLYSRQNNYWFLMGYTACLMQMINTSRLLSDPDDETDMVVFENRNGDYFLDTAYESDVEPRWYCLDGEMVTSMRRVSISIDSNGFNIIGTSSFSLVSFGVSTQDGTGIGYMSFSDDTISDNINLKGGGLLCDSGSKYDGLYYCGPQIATTGSWGDVACTWFEAFDSAHGIITNKPTAVEKDTQTAFSVSQNSPNPFNPTTSISFTIPGADHVTIEIYNVAGQKVDILVNDFMDAGKYSVVWDASGFSAGVYFYMVKSGDFYRTMKMTLLK